MQNEKRAILLANGESSNKVWQTYRFWAYWVGIAFFPSIRPVIG